MTSRQEARERHRRPANGAATTAASQYLQRTLPTLSAHLAEPTPGRRRLIATTAPCLYCGVRHTHYVPVDFDQLLVKRCPTTKRMYVVDVAEQDRPATPTVSVSWLQAGETTRRCHVFTDEATAWLFLEDVAHLSPTVERTEITISTPWRWSK